MSSQPLSALGQLYLGNWCQRSSLVCYSVSVTGYETEHKHISDKNVPFFMAAFTLKNKSNPTQRQTMKH